MLEDYLIKTNEIYKDEEAINDKKLELYDLKMYFNNFAFGNKKIFYCDIDLVSFDSISDDYSKEAYEFIHDIIFKPNFKNQKAFDCLKRRDINYFASLLQEQDKVAERIFNLKALEDNIETIDNSINIEFIKNEIEKVQLSDIEKMYNEIINNFYRGFVFGNISEKEFKEFRKYFPLNNNSAMNYGKKSNDIEECFELSNESMHESIVYAVYDYLPVSRNLTRIVVDILNNGGGLCHEILREKYGLVYTSYAFINYNRNLLSFYAKIDKNNKEKLLHAIDEIIDIMSDKEKIKEYLELTKNYEKKKNYLISENKSQIIEELRDYALNIYNNYNYNDFVSNIDNYTEENICDFAKTLKRKSTLMYRGENNEEL